MRVGVVNAPGAQGAIHHAVVPRHAQEVLLKGKQNGKQVVELVSERGVVWGAQFDDELAREKNLTQRHTWVLQPGWLAGAQHTHSPYADASTARDPLGAP